MIVEADTEHTTVNNEDHYLQLLPIQVKSEESLKVSVKPYFNGYIKETGNGLSSVFRGRPLNGKVKHLPNSYAAVIKFSRANAPLNDSSEMEHDDTEEKISCHTHSKTTKITCWNYDLPCDDNTNALDKALSYARLATVMSKDC